MYSDRAIYCASVTNIDSAVAGTAYVVVRAEPSSFGWTGYKLHHLRAGSIVCVW